MHRGGDYDETAYRRDMRRTTVREGELPKKPDDPFTDMFKASGVNAFANFTKAPAD
jgi:alpha-ketoglutarate-dependent 2,4-dichlorophenoxyacetate dioxygenase